MLRFPLTQLGEINACIGEFPKSIYFHQTVFGHIGRRFGMPSLTDARGYWLWQRLQKKQEDFESANHNFRERGKLTGNRRLMPKDELGCCIIKSGRDPSPFWGL